MAIEVATDAAELVADAYHSMRAGAAVDVATKSSATDVVTAIDTESERLIRARLAQLRPQDEVYGEEEGGRSDAARVTWFVDPIDGTVNFVHGHPQFAVSVAASLAGRMVAGAVVEPVSGRVWTAARGAGAWLGADRLRVSDSARLDLAVVATGFAYRTARRRRQAALLQTVLGEVADVRRAGSAALDLCAVAAGWVDGYYEHGLGPWDWAAGTLIAEEAGATVVFPGDEPRLGAGAIVAAAPSVFAGLRAALIDADAAGVEADGED